MGEKLDYVLNERLMKSFDEEFEQRVKAEVQKQLKEILREMGRVA